MRHCQSTKIRCESSADRQGIGAGDYSRGALKIGSMSRWDTKMNRDSTSGYRTYSRIPEFGDLPLKALMAH